jgi:hypothetical protein
MPRRIGLPLSVRHLILMSWPNRESSPISNELANSRPSASGTPPLTTCTTRCVHTQAICPPQGIRRAVLLPVWPRERLLAANWRQRIGKTGDSLRNSLFPHSLASKIAILSHSCPAWSAAIAQVGPAVHVAQPAMESGNSHRLAFGGHGRFTRVRVNSLVSRLCLGAHWPRRLCLPSGHVSDHVEQRQAEPRSTGVRGRHLGTRENATPWPETALLNRSRLVTVTFGGERTLDPFSQGPRWLSLQSRRACGRS